MDEAFSYNLGRLKAPNGFILKSNEEFLWCPFDPVHIILNTQMDSHLFKCRRAYLKQIQKAGYLANYLKCRFNPDHLLIDVELKFHEESCPYRRSRAIRRASRMISPAVKSNPEEWDADQVGPPSTPERKGHRSPTPIPRDLTRRRLFPSPKEKVLGFLGRYPPIPGPPRHDRKSPTPTPELGNEPDIGYGSSSWSSDPNGANETRIGASYGESLKFPVFHRSGNIYTPLEPEPNDNASEPSQLMRDVHKHVTGKVNLIQMRKIETMDHIEKEALEDWDLHAKLFPPPIFDAMKSAEFRMCKYLQAPPGLTKSERKAWRLEWAEKIPRVYDPNDPDFADKKEEKDKLSPNKEVTSLMNCLKL
jgi:hypothetical protein